MLHAFYQPWASASGHLPNAARGLAWFLPDAQPEGAQVQLPASGLGRHPVFPWEEGNMSLTQDPGKGSKIALISGSKHRASISMCFLLFRPFCRPGKPDTQ